MGSVKHAEMRVFLAQPFQDSLDFPPSPPSHRMVRRPDSMSTAMTSASYLQEENIRDGRA